MERYEEKYEECKCMDEDEAVSFIEAGENEHFM